MSDHWGLVSDVQLRTSDDWEDLRTLILHPSVSYFLDKNNRLSGGYAYIATYSPGMRYLTEHRSWQQFIAQRKYGEYPLTHRLRKIGLPAVLKTRTLGYDNKGQAVLRNAGDLDAAWARLGGARLILEGFVPGVHWHAYGKQARPSRKLGHATHPAGG